MEEIRDQIRTGRFEEKKIELKSKLLSARGDEWSACFHEAEPTPGLLGWRNMECHDLCSLIISGCMWGNPGLI